MKILPWVCYCILFPALLLSQENNRELDSLSRPLPASATVREQAEQCRVVMWYIFINAIDKYEYWPDRLDSLFHCCIEGKTNDELIEKTIDAEIYFHKGFKELVSFKSRNAKQFLESALTKYAAYGDSAKMGWTHLLLCRTFIALGDSLSFFKHYEQSNKLNVYIKSHKDIAIFHLDSGASCYAFGKLTEAASHFFKTLELIDQYGNLGHYASKSIVFDHLVNIFYDIGDFDNGERYSRISIQLAIDEKRDPSNCYVNLARCIKGKCDYKEALLLLKIAEQSNRFNTNDWYRGLVLTHQAECYRKFGNTKTALKLMEQVRELAPMTTDVWYRSYALWELAECEFALGMTDKALKHAIESYGEFKKLNNSRYKMASAGLISNIYKTERNYRKALEYNELRYKHLQEVAHQQSGQKMALGEFTRDNAAEKARREAEVQAQLDQQRTIRYGLFASLGILALLAFLLYNRYRFKQRSAVQLEAKNIEVEAARARAEASEAFKSRFLANMSHEIRTPLHGIAGFTDLLLETSLTEKQRRWLSSVHHSAGRLGEVVNDILDLSKLEAGGMKLRQVPFSPARVASDVQDALSVRAENKGIGLAVHIGENVPEAVLGDPTRLYQILMNLVGNAVKFTEIGNVTLSVKVVSPVSDGVTSSHPVTTPAMLFTVVDTGIGIPPEKLSTIFDSFQQSSEDTAARFGGTGLGLTIARELVQLHGSDIRAVSEVGNGSTFSFTLAFPPAEAADLENTASAGDTLYFPQPIRILLTDDNALNREIATEAIRRHFENADIAEAVNGKEAVELLGQRDFEIVLMDMQMPEMNGIQAAQHIRQYLPEGKKDVPIIALTASATPEEIENALESGMNRHLGKPFKPHELARVVAETLGLAAGEALMPGAKADLPGFENQEGLDLGFLRDFCDGDEERMRHFIQKFVEQYPTEICRLEAAVQAEDRETVYQVAHSFRPQLEFVGLKKAGQLVAVIEREARSTQQVQVLSELLKDLNHTLDATFSGLKTGWV